MTDLSSTSPPQNLDAERRALGLAIYDPGHARRLVDELRPRDFALGSHQHIWQVLRELVEAGRDLSAMLLCEELERHGKLESVGGMSYIVSLDDGLNRLCSPEESIRIVREKSVMRHVYFGCQKLALRSLTDDPAAVVADAEAMFRSMVDQMAAGSTGGLRSARAIIADAGGPDALFEGAMRGLLTPWAGLNHLTLGLHRAEMTVLAGRTGRGKSAMATQIAAYALRQNAGAVAVFSLEMPGAAVIRRMACGETEISANRVRRGDASPLERVQLSQAAVGIGRQELLYISDRQQVTISTMSRDLRRLCASSPVALVVVDYLQLMAGSGRAENRQTEIAGLSRALKHAAMEFNVPMLVLCQYNREADKADTRPGLQHLRESGAISHDADGVWLLHEPEGMGEQGWTTELIVEKQREGPTDSVWLWFDRQRTRFVSRDENDAD